MARATTDDLAAMGLPSESTADIDLAVQQEHLDAAAGTVDSFLKRGRYILPLAAPYPREIVSAECTIAAYSLMVWRGFKPADVDAALRDQLASLFGRRDVPGSTGWLDKVASGEVTLSVARSQKVAGIKSDDTRGW